MFLFTLCFYMVLPRWRSVWCVYLCAMWIICRSVFIVYKSFCAVRLILFERVTIYTGKTIIEPLTAEVRHDDDGMNVKSTFIKYVAICNFYRFYYTSSIVGILHHIYIQITHLHCAYREWLTAHLVYALSYTPYKSTTNPLPRWCRTLWALNFII